VVTESEGNWAKISESKREGESTGKMVFSDELSRL
jgi:hypothetical protein